MAGLIVRKAAKGASSPSDLVNQLADKIDAQSERQLFLQQMTAKLPTQPNRVDEAGDAFLDTQSIDDHGGEEIDEAVIEKASKFLASQIGPIALSLTLKASEKSGSVSDFLSILAEHMDDEIDKQKFLDHMNS